MGVFVPVLVALSRGFWFLVRADCDEGTLLRSNQLGSVTFFCYKAVFDGAPP